MKQRRRLGIFASALLFTGITLLPHDTLEAQKPCPNLAMEEPQFTGSEYYKHKLLLLLDSKNEKSEMRDKMEADLVGKIENLGPSDSYCAQNVRDAALKYDIRKVARASVDALVRFNTGESRDILYTLAFGNASGKNSNLNEMAVDALTRLDPEMAANALLRRGLPKNYQHGMHIFDEAQAKTGSERVLQHYINNGTTRDVARFIRQNTGKPFIQRYRDLLMPMLERDILKESYSPFNYGTQFKCGIYERDGATVRETEIEYAFAMRELDKVYAEQVLVPIAQRSQGCSPYLVRALQGTY